MPKTREQNQQIKEERREAILEIALEEFALRGYGSVKTDDITKKAKCSHGLFYHYFSTKEELFHAVMKKNIDKLMAIENSVDYTQKAKFALHDLLDVILSAIKSCDDSLACAYYLLLNLHLEKDIIPKPNKPKPKQEKILFEKIYDLILEGQKDGDFLLTEAKESTIAITCILNGVAYHRIKLGKQKFVCPGSQILMNLVLKRNE